MEHEARHNIKGFFTMAGGIVGTLAIIIGAGFTIDSRFVHAEDLKKVVDAAAKVEHDTNNSIFSLYQSQRVSDEELKLLMIDSQILFLEQKEKKTNTDRAYISRLQNQRSDVVRNVQQLRAITPKDFAALKVQQVQ